MQQQIFKGSNGYIFKCPFEHPRIAKLTKEPLFSKPYDTHEEAEQALELHNNASHR